MGQFVAIRMIVLDYTKALKNPKASEGPEDPDNRRDKRKKFEDWMIGTFLDEMGKAFQGDGLQRITFLRGNKKEKDKTGGPLQSKNNATGRGRNSASRAKITEAGANADFAWITYWESKQKNRKAWKKKRTAAWYKLWDQFTGKCQRSGRPTHGPPFDYKGLHPVKDAAELAKLPAGSPNPQPGAGAGFLVEGFEVAYDRGKPWL